MRTGSSEDYYALLGVAADASGAGLRRAWRRLALRWHPDRAGTSATATFQRIELFSGWLAIRPGVADSAVIAPTAFLRGMLRPVSFRIRLPFASFGLTRCGPSWNESCARPRSRRPR